MSNTNLATLVRQQAQSRPSKVATELARERMTYTEAWRRISTLAAWLQSLDCKPDDRIGVALAESIDHVLLQFAVPAMGGVYVPIDHRWSASEQQTVVESFAVSKLIGSNTTSVSTPLPDSLNEVADFDCIDGGERDWLVSLSSGSTGKPKGALVTHAQMRERFIAQWVSLGFNTNDRFALVTPLCFGAGRSFSMSTLAAGATLIVVPPPVQPDNLVAVINEHEATATFMVPTMMRRLLALDNANLLLPKLRRLLLSGEATRADEADAFRTRISPNLIGYYASSEGGGISVLQPQQFSTHAHTAGQAAFGVQIQIVDEQGQAVVVGVTGQLRYRGPGVTTRALDEHGNALDADADGWFYPGDLAEQDNDGFVILRGRSKDMIVRAGINIYPAQIEQVIAAMADVQQVSVVGLESSTHGESVHAFVVGTVTIEQLEAHCAKRLARYKQPESVHIVDELPLTTAGKLDRQALRALL